MVEYLVIKTAQDAVDAGILLTAEIALIISSISAGISGLFLIDYFRRLRRKRRVPNKEKKGEEYLKKEKENTFNPEKL